MKIKQTMKRFLETVAFLLIIFFLVNYFIKNWNKIGEFQYEINWFYLSLSFLSLFGALFFLPLSLKNIVKVLGYEISIKKMCSVLFYSQIAKYIPGGIWAYVGRVYLYRKEGMSATDAPVCVFLETLLVLLSGTFVFFVSLLFLDKIPSIASIEYIRWIPNEYINEIWIIVVITLFLLMHPKILNILTGLIPMRISRNRDKLKFDYNYFSLLRPAFFLVLFWLGMGLGFWLLIRTLFYIDVFLLPLAIGTYVLAWIIGFLAFFTPGGLGVRETVLVLMLNLYLPVYISAVLAILSRVWWIIGELVWVLFSFVWNRFDGASKKT